MGFSRAGFKCVFSCDINEDCRKTYNENYGEMPLGDICKISEKTDIPEHDILCAGFPCQPFSISGKQKGFQDTRGTLFFEICRIIKEKRPKVVFLENVKHLVHHDSGNTLKVILKKLEELGYDVEWKVLNASNFGVPQNRERIIIVASRIGKFDFTCIKKHKKVEYIILFTDGKLNRYLHEIDIACEDRIKTIISQLVKQENVTEELNELNNI